MPEGRPLRLVRPVRRRPVRLARRRAAGRRRRVVHASGGGRRLRGRADHRAVPQRFHFRLEPVRALSERREEEARGALAVALADESAARVRLQDAVERSTAAVRELGEHMTSGPVTGDALRAREAWIARTTEQHEAMLLDVDRRITESDARRGLLAGAARDREVLERLRGRRRAEHRAAEDRAEQERLDEIAIGLHRRRAA